MSSAPLTYKTLQVLKEALSDGHVGGPLSLRDFGEMLGRAADRPAYGKGYVSKLLRGIEPITPKVTRAARILMVGVAGLDERDWVDPLPSFKGGPVEKLKAARSAGVAWAELYAGDANVREFVDTLVDLIARG